MDADRAEANVGDLVNYVITLENISDEDMTDLYVSHSYPTELAIEKSVGGRNDGREVQWKRPILRSGEIATYSLTARVVGGAPGIAVRSLTRAMVSEFENIAPVESYLAIMGGTAQGGLVYHMVQTGPMSTLMLLISSARYEEISRVRQLK